MIVECLAPWPLPLFAGIGELEGPIADVSCGPGHVLEMLQEGAEKWCSSEGSPRQPALKLNRLKQAPTYLPQTDIAAGSSGGSKNVSTYPSYRHTVT